MDGYLLKQDKFDTELCKTYEGLMAQGNGYLHVRATFEEGLTDAPQDELYLRIMKSVTTEIQRNPLSKYGVYIPLIMGNNPHLGEVIINLPYFMDIKVSTDGEALDMQRCNITDYVRTLDLKTGELTRSFLWNTVSGCIIRLDYSRFASMDDSHLFVQRVDCKVLSGAPLLEWQSGIDANVTTNGYNHFAEVEMVKENDALCCRLSTDLNCDVTIRSIHEFCDTDPAMGFIKSGNRAWSQWRHQGKSGEVHSFQKLTSIATSRDKDNEFASTVRETLTNSCGKGYEFLLEKSARVWETLWQSCDVIVDGDSALQGGIRQSIYHMIRCNTGIEERIQVCAKGFAGEAYFGRYFWDSEIYLLPFYLHTNPSAARCFVMYRYHTLDGARRNAARYNCRGARYPWQSGIGGDEQCSQWEYADNEVHITADVAFAVVHYYRVTDDYHFLRDFGLEILLETARFWLDRIDYDDEGQPHLLNVMGPDEYSPMTRDNAYTNRMVRFNLEAAAAYAKKISELEPDFYKTLCDRIGFTDDENESFIQVAVRLTLPYDPMRDLFLQSSDFEEYASIDIDGIWKDKSRPFGFFASQEKIYRSRCIKQADVIALMTLFPKEFTDSQVSAAYSYYMPMTVHDSSLSPAGHAMAANRLGLDGDVQKFLNYSVSLDFSPERKGAQEGIHIANCGCLWQLLIYGFAGMQSGVWSDTLSFSPKLPDNIRSITFPLCWRGEEYTVTVETTGTVIINLNLESE